MSEQQARVRSPDFCSSVHAQALPIKGFAQQPKQEMPVLGLFSHLHRGTPGKGPGAEVLPQAVPWQWPFQHPSQVDQEQLLKASIQSEKAKLERMLQDTLGETPAINGPVKALLRVDCPLHSKYQRLPIVSLLRENCKEVASLDKFAEAMHILSKYGKNLLKPPSTRPSQWASVVFTNTTYREKIDWLQGARDILQWLGYVVTYPGGLSFPENTEPDVLKVAPLVTEIIMTRQEVLGYCLGTHPQPQHIENVLPPHVRVAQQTRPQPQQQQPMQGAVKPLAPPTNDLSLPPPVWSRPVPYPNSNGVPPLIGHPQCEVCGSEAKWMCAACSQKMLCASCDPTWHKHQKRSNHLRSPLTSPGQQAPVMQRPPPVGTAGPLLPTTLDTAKTLTEEDVAAIQETMSRLRPEIQQLKHLPPGVPNISIFETTASEAPPVGQEEHGAMGGADIRGRYPVSPKPPESLLDQIIIISDINHRKSKLNLVESQTLRRLRALESEAMSIIKEDPSFYLNPRYKCLKEEEKKVRSDREELERYKIVIRDEEQYRREQHEQTQMGSFRRQISHPPPVYTPPPIQETIHPLFLNTPFPRKPENNDRLLNPPTGPSLSGSPTTEQKPLPLRWQGSDESGYGTTHRKDSSSSTGSSSASPSPKDTTLKWVCQHCTYRNLASKRICDICLKTSEKPEFVKEEEEESSLDQNSRFLDRSLTPDPRLVSYQEEAEKVVREKKEAQERDRRLMQEREDFPSSCTSASNSLSCSRVPQPVTLRQGPQRSQSMMITKVTPPLSGTRKSVSEDKDDVRDVSTPVKESAELLRFKEAFNQGKVLANLLRMGENDGFSSEEVELGVEQAGLHQGALSWLNNIWMPFVERIVSSTTNHHGALLSKDEVRRILLENSCDMDKAQRLCSETCKQKVMDLMTRGTFSEAEAEAALARAGGEMEEASRQLNQKSLDVFRNRLWQPTENPACTSAKFEADIRDENRDIERRIRMLLVECRLQGWVRADCVLRILNKVSGEEVEDGENVTLEDVVEAVRNCDDFHSACNFLKQECQICYNAVPRNKLQSLVHCECQVCISCLRQYIVISVRERHVRDWLCPRCSQPDLDDEDVRNDHFTFMDLLLKNVLDKEVHELFQKKLRDWTLMQDPNFRWCSHCSFGFLFNSDDGTLKMKCPDCNCHTCFKCKKHWEDQHEGVSCQQFQAWKEANDPEHQAAGLAKILEENGIDCPNCKFRYTLAKGGCMHFNCTQCGHEFCSGCYQPFKRSETCHRFETCARAGLHCHHPRDCLFYLRDYPVAKLQQLLKNENVAYNTDVPPSASGEGEACPVMELKELPQGFVDQSCGHQVSAHHAGLCEVHYKEYLVGLINRHHIDPVTIMSIEALNLLLVKNNEPVPAQRRIQSEADYWLKLSQVVQSLIPLLPREAPGSPMPPHVAITDPLAQGEPGPGLPGQNGPHLTLPVTGTIFQATEDSDEGTVHWL